MIPAANLTRQFTWSRIFKHNSEEWESSMVHYHNPRNRKNLLLVHLQSPSVQFLVEQWPRNLGTSIMSWMPLNIKNMAGRTFANWTHAQALLCIRSRCCWLCFFRTFRFLAVATCSIGSWSFGRIGRWSFQDLAKKMHFINTSSNNMNQSKHGFQQDLQAYQPAFSAAVLEPFSPSPCLANLEEEDALALGEADTLAFAALFSFGVSFGLALLFGANLRGGASGSESVNSSMGCIASTWDSSIIQIFCARLRWANPLPRQPKPRKNDGAGAFNAAWTMIWPKLSWTNTLHTT